MLSFRVFGELSLSGPDGPLTGRATQRRRLALLAVLAVARGRPVTRDKLVALLWPDADTERSRHGLADSLYVLRDALGDDVIVVTGDALSLNPDGISSDVMAFEDAIEKGERERACEIYEAGGVFLDGIHLSDAGEFERWADSVRARLESIYRKTLDALATEASARGDSAVAVGWWRKLAAADRLSSRVTLGLMRALADSGDRAGALEVARIHASIVQAELESAPDATVTAFAESLRSQPARVAPATTSRARPPEPELATVPIEAVGVALSPRVARLRFGWVVLLVLAVPLALYSAMRPSRPPSGARVATPAPDTRRSIVVLPFVNVGADTANNAFVDGMTEELTTALSHIAGLHVIAATSAMAFKGHQIDVRKIADSLGVSFVLEGSLQRADRHIRLTIRLIDAADGSTRWSEQYDRELADVFAVQDDVGRSVAKALEIRFVSLARDAHLMRGMTSDPVAYEWYVQGRDPRLRRSDSGNRAAADYFLHAISLDTTFAAAYAGLAGAYWGFARTGGTAARPARVLFDSAEAAAMKAVSLCDSLADAHARLAQLKLSRLDLAAALTHVNHALALDPNDPLARPLLGILYEWTGRRDDAVVEARRTLDTDRLSPDARVELARALFFAGHDDEALAELDSLRGLRPPLKRALEFTALIYLNKKMWDQAASALRVPNEGGVYTQALLARALAQSGDRGGATHILEDLLARQRVGTADAFSVANVYVGLGDWDRAFVWLNKSVDDRSMRVHIMDPTFAQLRADPRFAHLRRRIGIDAIVGQVDAKR